MFVPLLQSYTYNNKQARTVVYEFIIVNKHEVMVFKAKFMGDWGRSHQARFL